MGIFDKSLGLDTDIEKATSETNTNENWSLIMDVCDKVSSNPRNAKDCLRSIMKRMNHNDPHVAMQAITLLNACANNCGKAFHLEVASREFENEFRRLLSKAQPKVSLKMRQVLKTWAEKDFKNDPELNLIPSLYMKLQQEGHDFSSMNEKSLTSHTVDITALKNPNVVSSQQEEDDLVKAIELSLQEIKNSPKQGPITSVESILTSAIYPSLYPSFGNSINSNSTVTDSRMSSTTSAVTTTQVEPRKVRALYDFEAAEDNELTFLAGEIVHVTDDLDPNWWKGYNQRGEGLFPSNFVSADLSIERLDINQQHKNSHTNDEDSYEMKSKNEEAASVVDNQKIEINECKIDRLLHLLHEANPEDPTQDTEEMLCLEHEVHQMGPLIDAELERVDRKHAQLSQLSSDLVDAINVYHSLMRDDRSISNSPFMTANMTPNILGAMHSIVPQPNTSLYGSSSSYLGNLNTSLVGYGNPIQATQGTQFSTQDQMSVPVSYQNGNMGLQQAQLQQQIALNLNPNPNQIINGQPMSSVALQPQFLQQQQLQRQQSSHNQQIYVNSVENHLNQNFQNGSQGKTPNISMDSSALPMAAHNQEVQQQNLNVVQGQYMTGQLHHQPSFMNNTMQTMIVGDQNPIPVPVSVSVPIQTSNANVTEQHNQLPYNTISFQNMGSQIWPISSMPGVLPNTVQFDQFGQLQHQLANLTVGQPDQSASYVSTLTQNIPVYQQQQ